MINDEDFQIGNCCKTITIFSYRIPKNSNVIYLGSQPFSKHGKIIKLLYIGKIYHFSTFMSLDAWLKVLDNPTTTE